MATALTGTVDFNTQTNAGVGNLKGTCIDSSGTFCYAANDNGKIYQITVSSGVASGGSWPLTGLTSPNQVCLSSDDQTLYILQDNGQVYSSPVSSPSATLLGTFNGLDSLTSAWRHLILDPGPPRATLFGATTSGKKIYGMSTADGTTTYVQPVGKGTNSHFINGLGTIPGDPDSILITLSTMANLNQSGFTLLRWKRYQGRFEVLLGSGSSTNTTGSGPAQGFSPINNANCCGTGDPDGRIYLPRSSAVLTMIDTSGTVSNINASLPQSVVSGCNYCPAVNKLVMGASGARVYIIS